MPAVVFFLLSAGCTATGTSSGGMAAYVDPLSGRQVVVETAGTRATGAAVAGPAAQTVSEPGAAVGVAAGADAPGGAAAVPATGDTRLLSLTDTDYVDVEVMDRELARRAGERFYVLPDGTGTRQTVLASEIGADEPARLPPVAAPAAAAADPWRRCLPPVAISLVDRGTDVKQVLRFPAIAARRQHAGFRVGVPDGRRTLTLWAMVQKGAAVPARLAVLDAAGQVFAVAYTVPTESLPETAFRYGRVGFSVPLPEVPAGGALAVLDAARLPALPAACRPPAVPADAAPAPASAGTVTLDFIP